MAESAPAAAMLSSNSTPLKHDVTKILGHTRVVYNADALKRLLGQAMNGYFRGPKGSDGFIDKLMPISEADIKLIPESVVFALPKEENFLENALYGQFKKTVEDYGISPKFKVIISADGKKGLKEGLYRPDVAFEDMDIHQDTSQEGKPNAGVEARARSVVNWHSDGLVVEFKRKSSDDPFNTRAQMIKAAAQNSASPEQKRKGTLFPKSDQDHVETQGQLALYATRTFGYQHRTHIFQLLICGDLARFLFWDHSGALVSEEFNYVANPSLLAKFIWHYNHMSPEARGYDRTASIASSVESGTFHTQVRDFLNDIKRQHPSHPLFESLLPGDALDKGHRVYKLKVMDSVTQQQVHVLIQRSFVLPQGPVGRGTRGYIAYCIEDEKVGFLKETWRVVHPRLRVERQILGELNSSVKTKLVPTVFYGGDVTGTAHCTRGKEWDQDRDVFKYSPSREFQHHRLFEEFALPVRSARNSKVYTKAFLEALIAMFSAYDLLKLLHRDLSINNIMIVYRDGQPVGILCDWDHAGEVNPPTEILPQAFRTGTWQFMSIAMLGNPRKVHDILDDCESLFWTFLYGAIHGYEHKNTGVVIGMFDERNEDPNDPTLVTGGTVKRAMLIKLRDGALEFGSPALTGLVQSMAGLWDDFYQVQENIHNEESTKAEIQRRIAEGTAPPVPEEYQAPEFSAYLPSYTSTQSQYDERILAINAELTKLRQKQVDLRKSLSDPKTWTALFFTAIGSAAWDENDACTKHPYPQLTSRQQTRMKHMSQATTQLSGTALEAFNNEHRGLPREIAANILKAQQEDVEIAVERLDTDDADENDHDGINMILTNTKDIKESGDLDDEQEHAIRVMSRLVEYYVPSAQTPVYWTSRLHPSSPTRSSNHGGSSFLTELSSGGSSKRGLDDSHDPEDKSSKDDRGHPASKKPRRDGWRQPLFGDKVRDGGGAHSSHDVFGVEREREGRDAAARETQVEPGDAEE